MDSRQKVLEFRLKINHASFLQGTPDQQAEMILEALRRSVSLMRKFGISQEDCIKLLEKINGVTLRTPTTSRFLAVEMRKSLRKKFPKRLSGCECMIN